MNQPANPGTPAPAPAQSAAQPDSQPDTQPVDDPALQGEGNYAAARRHRESVERFIDAGKVQPAADNAAPADAEEAEQLRAAEEEGQSHAKT